MKSKKNSNSAWWTLKGRIVTRFGSVTECARQLQCSTQALRATTEGRCPDVARKLNAALQEVAA